MTREEIKSLTINEGHSLTFKVYSEAFNKEIQQRIYIPTLNWDTGMLETDMDQLVTDYVTDCVNNFLDLDSSNFMEELKDEIFRIFEICIEGTSYGQVPDEWIEKHGNTEANRIFFNGRDRDSVFETCNIHEAYYTQDSGPELRYLVYIKIDWEMEHGLTIFFENGRIVSID
jgi:hypothetical protein